MEVKKSAQANLEKGKLLSILMGLIVALSTVFVSFEWGTKEIESTYYKGITELPVEEDILITIPEPTTPPPPPPPAPVAPEELNIVDDETDVASVDIASDEDNPWTPQDNIPAPPMIDDEEEEEQGGIFEIVEEMPEFPGGNGELLKFINKTVKYPVIAQENNIQGRVVCTFTVNQDGSIVDPEVVRGIDPSLDKEAIRVIGNMPKWKPGKQRGKPVRVKYTLPIMFRLQ